MKIKVNLWDTKTLLILLAIGQGCALVYSGVAFDGHDMNSPLFWLSIVRGLPVGLGASFAASYTSYELPRGNKGKRVKLLGYVALSVLLASSVVLVSICTFATPENGWRVAASVAYAVLTDAAAVAVAAASGRLFADQQDKDEEQQRPARTKKTALEFKCHVAGCGMKKPTQKAINAHMRVHRPKSYILKNESIFSQEKQ